MPLTQVSQTNVFTAVVGEKPVKGKVEYYRGDTLSITVNCRGQGDSFFDIDDADVKCSFVEAPGDKEPYLTLTNDDVVKGVSVELYEFEQGLQESLGIKDQINLVYTGDVFQNLEGFVFMDVQIALSGERYTIADIVLKLTIDKTI